VKRVAEERAGGGLIKEKQLERDEAKWKTKL
jgi:hypothetical protein